MESLWTAKEPLKKLPWSIMEPLWTSMEPLRNHWGTTKEPLRAAPERFWNHKEKSQRVDSETDSSFPRCDAWGLWLQKKGCIFIFVYMDKFTLGYIFYYFQNKDDELENITKWYFKELKNIFMKYSGNKVFFSRRETCFLMNKHNVIYILMYTEADADDWAYAFDWRLIIYTTTRILLLYLHNHAFCLRSRPTPHLVWFVCRTRDRWLPFASYWFL